jgi:hypothetical protein
MRTPTTSATTTAEDAAVADRPQQLSLLAGDVPLQFRLDERTRRSGLAHVAQLRAQMLAQAASRRSAASTTTTTDQQLAA